MPKPEKRKIKLLVNAIALTNIGTGIGRYIRNLYTELETRHGNHLDITYFDGKHLSKTMPSGPLDNRRWSLATHLFWRLPPRVGLAVRSTMHSKRETAFHRLAASYDLYHEPGFFPFRVPEHVKTVFTIHDMSVHRHPEHHPKERVLFYDNFFPARSRQADHILTVSEFSKSEILACTDFQPGQIHVTPLGYDPSVFFSAKPEDSKEVLAKLNLPDRYFIFLGTDDPRKKLHLIPPALKCAALNVPLVVAGWSGWSNKGAPENVINLGYLPDDTMRIVLSNALALVFPSIYEGFGLPILEAMACGCPVVTNHMASMPEVGGNAVIYLKKPGNVQEMGNCLKEIANNQDLRRGLIRKGLERARTFSWEKTAAKTFEVFMKSCN